MKKNKESLFQFQKLKAYYFIFEIQYNQKDYDN